MSYCSVENPEDFWPDMSSRITVSSCWPGPVDNRYVYSVCAPRQRCDYCKSVRLGNLTDCPGCGAPLGVS